MRAAITVDSAVNGASFLHSSLPNGKLAPGVLFSVFGSGMGPGALAQVSSFPIPAQLEGTSVRVTIGGLSIDCPIVFTVNYQVGAILPSHVPLGSGSLNVRYNGESSNSLDIQVVPHAFGIFAVSQSGKGAGVLAHPVSGAANSLLSSANPGQMIDIWGTGLGAVAANEAIAPAPGDLVNLDVQVFVGALPAQVTYRGRSGCCAGVDQIRFIVPAGVSGCHVPVHVRVNGVSSNYVTMSIAESGSVCSNPGGFSAAELQIAQQNGGIRSGSVSLRRSRHSEGTQDLRIDQAEGFFYRFAIQELLRRTAPLIPAAVLPTGTCIVEQFLGAPGIGIAHGGLDAGRISLSGPPGFLQLIGSGLTGHHQITFLPGGTDIEGIIHNGTLLTPGAYTFHGAEGTQVGPFLAYVFFPQLEWSNMDSFQEIDRNKSLTITWQGGTPAAIVRVSGSSLFAEITTRSTSGATNRVLLGISFSCWTDASAGSFTIPSEIVASLPRTLESLSGSLSISLLSFNERFPATGLDVGRIVTSDSISKKVSFQ
jgi:uncharacterized protein (TIGR03437 family)